MQSGLKDALLSDADAAFSAIGSVAGTVMGSRTQKASGNSTRARAAKASRKNVNEIQWDGS